MDILVGKHSWLTSVVVFFVCIICLAVTWSVMDSASLIAAFDNDGHSPFELMTIPVFAMVVPMIWLNCPFKGSLMRKCTLSSLVTLLIVMAIIKETDLHLAIFNSLYGDSSQYLMPHGANFSGTPFKMRFITKCCAPFGAKLLVVSYFTILIGIGSWAIVRYFKPFWKGVFSLHPVAWSIGAMGGSGVMVMICDRLPAYLRHGGVSFVDDGSLAAFLKVLEEGGEMMIPILAILAIMQAHAIYAPDRAHEKWSNL